VEVAVTEPGRISMRCRETKGPVEFIRHESHTTLALLAKAVADFEERSKAWVIPANPKEFIAPVVTPPPPSHPLPLARLTAPGSTPVVQWDSVDQFARWLLREGETSVDGESKIVPVAVFDWFGPDLMKVRYYNGSLGQILRRAQKTENPFALSTKWLKEQVK
jgi:hypothetical protein